MSEQGVPGRSFQRPFPICWIPGEAAAGCRARAEELAREFDSFLLEELPENLDPDKYPVVLLVASGGIELRLTGKKAPGGVRVDFTSGAIRRRVNTASRRQPLARAVMHSKNTGIEAGITVLDATAGLGRDAYALACLGAEVTAVERAPVLYALLREGVERGRREELEGGVLRTRFRLLHSDARQLIASPEFHPPEVVYLDPMYPPKRKGSAAVKKEMRVLQALLGPGADADAGSLLQAALGTARRRVVVKRPVYAPALSGKPDFEITGKLARYDVYLCAQP